MNNNLAVEVERRRNRNSEVDLKGDGFFYPNDDWGIADPEEDTEEESGGKVVEKIQHFFCSEDEYW